MSNIIINDVIELIIHYNSKVILKHEVSLVLVLHKVMTEGKSIENNKWDFDFESNLDTVGDPLGDRCLEV